MSMMGAQKDEEAITDINLTPLVDVSLVLVIIFMAVAPFAVQAGIQVLHSRAQVSQGKASLTENVQVTLKEDGELFIKGKAADFTGLFGAIQNALTLSKDRMVIVSADYKNRVGQVVLILDTARQAGAVKLALMKNEKA